MASQWVTYRALIKSTRCQTLLFLSYIDGDAVGVVPVIIEYYIS